MNQTKNKKFGNSIITERGLELIKKIQEFNEDKDITNPIIENEEDRKRIEEKFKKLEWCGKELKIEKKKSFDKAIENLATGIIDENKEFFKEHYPFVETDSFTQDQKVMIYFGYILGGSKVYEEMGDTYEEIKKILEGSMTHRNKYMGVEFG